MVSRIPGQQFGQDAAHPGHLDGVPRRRRQGSGVPQNGISVIYQERQLVQNLTAVPGQVLAVTGRGLWVKTGRGQVCILESEFDEDSTRPLASRLPEVCGPSRVILG